VVADACGASTRPFDRLPMMLSWMKSVALTLSLPLAASCAMRASAGAAGLPRRLVAVEDGVAVGPLGSFRVRPSRDLADCAGMVGLSDAWRDLLVEPRRRRIG